jgi:xanthine dehydrogenase accessory factor
LIIVGAVHLASPLTRIAQVVGFDVILVDPREAFASRERFPQVTQLIRKWPDEALREIALDNSAYIVVLTHDPKLDDPALMVALQSDARYVGALGSRRTNQKRMDRLRAAGLQHDQLSRLHAPVGLDLGGRSTEEIAVSIMAEIVREMNEGAR